MWPRPRRICLRGYKPILIRRTKRATESAPHSTRRPMYTSDLTKTPIKHLPLQHTPSRTRYIRAYNYHPTRWPSPDNESSASYSRARRLVLYIYTVDFAAAASRVRVTFPVRWPDVKWGAGVEVTLRVRHGGVRADAFFRFPL